MNKVHLSINYSQLMRSIFLVYRIALILLLLAALFLPHAFAVEDMWVAANRIIKDVYTKIAGVSTVLAGLMSAVAVIGAKMSGTQQKADQGVGLAQARLACLGHYQRHRRIYRLCPPAVQRSGYAGVINRTASDSSYDHQPRDR